jgi:hypothetical protein
MHIDWWVMGPDGGSNRIFFIIFKFSHLHIKGCKQVYIYLLLLWDVKIKKMGEKYYLGRKSLVWRKKIEILFSMLKRNTRFVYH